MFRRWGQALNRIVRAVDSLPAKRTPVKKPVQAVAAVRAREMLERIRRGEYEFSGSEICEILQRSKIIKQYSQQTHISAKEKERSSNVINGKKY